MVPFIKLLAGRVLPMTSKTLFQQCSGLKTLYTKQMLSAKEISAYKSLFDKMDSNGDGFLTKDDLRRGLRDHINYTASEKELDETMDTLDSDKDGNVGFGEFLEYIAWSKQMRTEDAIKYAFETFDTDKDGFINIEELKEALVSLGFKTNDTIINNILLAHSKNNTGTLSLKEFRNIFYEKNNFE